MVDPASREGPGRHCAAGRSVDHKSWFRRDWTAVSVFGANSSSGEAIHPAPPFNQFDSRRLVPLVAQSAYVGVEDPQLLGQRLYLPQSERRERQVAVIEPQLRVDMGWRRLAGLGGVAQLIHVSDLGRGKIRHCEQKKILLMFDVADHIISYKPRPRTTKLTEALGVVVVVLVLVVATLNSSYER